MNFERNLAFRMVRTAFKLSEARGLYVAAREVARSRALVLEKDSVSETLAR